MTRVVCLALSVVFGASLGFLATRSIAAAQSPGSLDAPARAVPSRPASPPVRSLKARLYLESGQSFIAARTPAKDSQGAPRTPAAAACLNVGIVEPERHS